MDVHHGPHVEWDCVVNRGGGFVQVRGRGLTARDVSTAAEASARVDGAVTAGRVLMARWSGGPNGVGVGGSPDERGRVMGEALTIGEVSSQTGLGVHALRFYERNDLLVDPIERSAGGQRRYSPTDVEWLRVCMKLRESGMPLAEIRRFAEDSAPWGGVVRIGEPTGS